MDTWVEEVEEWETRPFSGGYADLHKLADSSFSGVVSVGETWAVFVNGRVVSVTRRQQTAAGTEFTDGDIEVFADGEGTIRRAPHPGVALLIAMQLADGEPRGKYYTEDTPIEDVDETLTKGGFTGYLELSENVLSGDYYTVYQAGRSMDVAFVGNARRLQTDEEARESAHGEVGIYEVVAVDIDVTQLPEPEDREEPEQTGTATDATSDSASDAEPAPEPTADSNPSDPTTRDEVTVDADSPADPDTEPDPEPESSQAQDPEGPAVANGGPATADAEAASTSGRAESESPKNPPTGEPTTDRSRTASTSAEPVTEDSSASAAAEQLASRSIPSLDPERTASDGDQTQPPGRRRDRPGAHTDEPPAANAAGASVEQSTPDTGGDSAALAELRERLEQVEAERDDVREELAEARATLESVREERDDLRAEVERLREQVSELESTLGPAAAESGPALSPAEAAAGTDLFVRYDSKGATTVEDACNGDGSPEDLIANVGLDHHTRFETDGATVDGQPFAEWLHASQRYRFAEWVVSRLVFEIRDTGSAGRLTDLYEALPAVDRVEFDGTVTGETDGEAHDVEFDVVFRDRMGEPLFGAALHDGRDPVSDAAMAELVQDGTAVCESAETFAAAFYVTSAFYDPDALETASDATSGSLLSRDSRLSFVKRSRKRGFHLCLVEARDGGAFSLSVPEL
ncbi:hypothetical protein [Halosegnis sp.]|uniref:DUF7527 domain-containing protein n=1 Tax=Halosegnis sp. TaxID=2864959 RepID=UPI0035D40A3D